MANVTVKLVVMPTQVIHDKVSLPDNVPVGRLLNPLAERLNIKAPEGQFPKHRLTHKEPDPPGRFDFKEDDTLASRGVKDGSVLLFTAGFVAG